jgi:hypothetical protein
MNLLAPGEDVAAASVVAAYQAKIAALERKAKHLLMAIDPLEKSSS